MTEPAYSYVPGRFPHPHADPAGHHWGDDLPAAVLPDPDRWNESLHHVLGVQLFNHGYYWEAHELWESLWHACGRRGTLATFFKALIQLAVVGVKVRQNQPEGVLGHARRGHELLVGVGQTVKHLMGLRLSELITHAEQLIATPPVSRDPAATVEVVMPFTLELK